MCPDYLQHRFAGATALRFDQRGGVVDHRDYWNEVSERVEPYDSF